jgi:protein-disulfide isomerase
MLFGPQTVQACGEDGSCSTGPITVEQGDAILQELREIKLLLRQQAGGDPGTVRMAPLELKGPVTLALKAGARLGKKRAKVALIEFTDYQCPYCKRFYDSTFAALKKQYIDSGKVLYVGRNLPLPFHQYAKAAARATECAGDQGKYWQAHDALFAKSPELDDTTIKSVAQALKLNMKTFNKCMASDRHDKAIEADIQAASSIGIDGTPSFLLGKIEHGKVVGELIIGAQPLAAFAQKIDALLK